jgi:guanidinopropionase
VSEDHDPMLGPRYAGVPTFMRTPLAGDLSQLDIALVGVPYDGATEARPGARHGPRQIRDLSSMMRAIHPLTRIDPYELCNIADAGDVPLSHALDIPSSMAEIEAFYAKLRAADVVPVSAGGDHSITLPILRALAKGRPLGMFHVDAHTDTCDEEMGSRFSHGTPFRRAVEEGLLDPKRVIQIGIRGAVNSDEAWAFSAEAGMRVVSMDEFERVGTAAVIEEARKVIGEGPAYLTFDVDGLDPTYAPGTGTPEIGGLTTREGLALVRGMRGANLVGGDVVEVSPPFDSTGNTALVGATLMYEILCLLAEAVAGRKS